MAKPTNTQFAVAVHVMAMLATADGTRSSETMAASVATNPVHVRRVLARLRRSHLVASRPGPGGGWVLSCSPATTTIAEIWRAINGDDPALGLHAPAPACRIGQWVQAELEDVDRKVRKAIEAELSMITLADFVAGVVPGLSLAVA